jgi:hypothetical protein
LRFRGQSVQKLQTALHAKAKAEAGYRFYALYDKISREDILAHAYAQCRSNKGAPGVDGQDFAGRGLQIHLDASEVSLVPTRTLWLVRVLIELTYLLIELP